MPMTEPEARGMMRAISDHVDRKIERAIAPLQRRIAELENRQQRRLELIRQAAAQGRQMKIDGGVRSSASPSSTEAAAGYGSAASESTTSTVKTSSQSI